MHGAKRFLLLPPTASRFVYLHPVHHPHNGQARAHFDLPWGGRTSTSPEETFPAFRSVWGEAQQTVLRGGEILLLPANWLHHVSTEPEGVSVSANLWRQCPRSCNWAMGHLQYNDNREAPLPHRRRRLQAFIAGVVRSLLLRHEPLRAGERVQVVYPGPARNRYPATLRHVAGLGPSWAIEWQDGDAQHTRASPHHIYREGEPEFPAATPERTFAAELLEQRYAGLMEAGALEQPRWLPEGMAHPADGAAEGCPGDQGLSAEIDDTVAAFEAEHDGRTLRMYLSDWVDRLIGVALGVDEVPFFLQGLACPAFCEEALANAEDACPARTE